MNYGIGQPFSSLTSGKQAFLCLGCGHLLELTHQLCLCSVRICQQSLRAKGQEGKEGSPVRRGPEP